MRTWILAALAVAGLQAGALGQVLHQFASSVRGISDDGRVAVGSVVDRVTFRTAMTWTLEGGVNRIGLDPILTGYNISDVISGDGSTVFLGVRSGANPGYFRYLGPGQIERIPNTTSYSGFGLTDSSFDGRSGAAVAYGGGFDPPSQAARWTLDCGAQLLGYTRGGGDSWSSGCSSDGRTIVGWSRLGDFGDAFRWDEDTGMQILPSLTGTPTETSQALGVSSNGRFIVGLSGSGVKAVIWRDGIISSLGSIAGYNQSLATSVSDDGSVVVGTLESYLPFVWTADRGMELMTDYFTRLGVEMTPGLLFGNCKVSADGRTFYGSCGLEGGSNTGFVVTIPCPGAVSLGVAASAFVRRRRRPVGL